jgi:hypothetical protein
MGLFEPSEHDLKELEKLFLGEDNGPPPGFLEVERLSEPSSIPSLPQASQNRCVRVIDVREVTKLSTHATQCMIRVVFGTTAEEWRVKGSYQDLQKKITLAQVANPKG